VANERDRVSLEFRFPGTWALTDADDDDDAADAAGSHREGAVARKNFS
jgi:hypothetical protein